MLVHHKPMEFLEQLRYSGLFEARVPRYTSFPPVNSFAPGEGKLHYAPWLNAVPHDAQVSVYVHIPYCQKICSFCACRTQAVDADHIVAAYVDAVLREIALVRQKLPKRVGLSRLHLGGGTPTLLTPAQMRKLLNALYRAFPPGEAFEFSVEIDSTQIEMNLIEDLLASGMTRGVVGVQDFDPVVQNAIGRSQTFEQSLATVRDLRTAGLEKLDMELLYGLPRQSTASIAETTQQVLSLEPDRVAVNEYAHIPHVAKRQIMIDQTYLPQNEDAFLMSQVARQILLTDGYEAVGTDHYVRPGDALIRARDTGCLKRDFQGYSNDPAHALIGLGASAISRFPQGYVQNSSATSVYSKAISRGQLAANRGYSLTAVDHVIAFMIDMVMCQFEIDLAAARARFPGSRDLILKSSQAIQTVFGPFVDVTDDALVIKRQARPLARLIANVLDRLADQENDR